MANGSADKNKRSRKHRRNTRNLQSTYAQRQRINKWLETHLWHTRRMKMCSKYGFQLSKHCSDKGVRAAYKSLTHGCLISVSTEEVSEYSLLCMVFPSFTPAVINISVFPGNIPKKCADQYCNCLHYIIFSPLQDISYFSCVEVTGVQANVIKCLAPLFNSDTGK